MGPKIWARIKRALIDKFTSFESQKWFKRLRIGDKKCCNLITIYWEAISSFKNLDSWTSIKNEWNKFKDWRSGKRSVHLIRGAKAVWNIKKRVYSKIKERIRNGWREIQANFASEYNARGGL